MEFPKFSELMLPILQKMEDGKDYKRSEMFELLKGSYPEEVLSERLKSGGNKFQDRIGWAFTFLTKAEFIEASTFRRAAYSVTDLGRSALADGRKGVKIDEPYLKQKSPNYQKNWVVKAVSEEQLEKDEAEAEEAKDPFATFQSMADKMKETAKFDFINKLRASEWEFFEDFCVDLIEKNGLWNWG